MAGNPRIEDLRKRIEKDPGSRLFAQLAEELRKDGDLADAIAVAREGLQKHPNYPSARMTLGRALLDTGDFGAARSEFEQVVKGAPDNILASRYLAECLENLGEQPAAIARYKATLALAPGDKQILARIEALEGGASGVAAVGPGGASAGLRTPSAAAPPASRAGAAPAPAAMAPPPPLPPLAPIPLAAVEGEMELESAHDRPAWQPPPPAAAPVAGASPDAAPIPLVAVDEAFELEQPFENPTAAWGTPAPSPAPPPPPADPETPLATPTLAELYFNQGSTEKAIEVYRELVERDPANQRALARLKELEALQRALGADEPPATRERAAPREPLFSPPEPAFSSPTFGRSSAPPAFDIDLPDDEPIVSAPSPAAVSSAATVVPPAPPPQPLSTTAPAPGAAPPLTPGDRREVIEGTITRLEQFLEKVQRR